MKQLQALILIFILTACGQSNFLKQKYTNLKPLKPTTEDVTGIDNTEDEVLDAAEKKEPFAFVTITPIPVSDETTLDEDCGDQLTFKSGAFLKVKIIQVNKSDIVYRRCDDLNGPAYTVIKDDLAEAKLKDGSRLDLTDKTTNSNTNLEEPIQKNDRADFELSDKEKPIEPFAIAAFILAITGIFWFLAVGLAIASLIIQYRNPETYRKLSKVFALIALIVPIAFIFLIVFLVILFF